ncbi:hypothetical protein EXU85_27580 [Spirosoma sp. KCTC 42546]|uniref:hypothetical protein n=1 Tax=Spirosoma sp. KCTC 42546 TaxID=2520506 RepID=UPI00115995F3|nr:hypothetical protein [Spirosoma sp. KCTC 42546]QDK82168.1 hypothetical protein EXU85_27580 [Spirosoma sp. KCTC 42546]
MKNILYILTIMGLLSFQTPVPVELSGTSWKGKALLPNFTVVIMKFSRGVVSFYDANNAQHLITTARYEQNSSFVLVHAKAGVNSCPKAGNWLYHLDKNPNGISFLVLDSPCRNKASLLAGSAFTELE